MVTSNKTVLYTIMYKMEFQDLKYPVGIIFVPSKQFNFNVYRFFVNEYIGLLNSNITWYFAGHVIKWFL